MKDPIPKNCQGVRPQLPEYAEGKLTGPAAAAVGAHVAACARCRQEVADLRVVLSTLHAIPAAEIPEDLVGKATRAVIRRAPQRAAPRPLWSRLAVPMAAATAVLAIFLARHTLEPGTILPQSGPRARAMHRASKRRAKVAPQSAASAPATAGEELASLEPTKSEAGVEARTQADRYQKRAPIAEGAKGAEAPKALAQNAHAAATAPVALPPPGPAGPTGSGRGLSDQAGAEAKSKAGAMALETAPAPQVEAQEGRAAVALTPDMMPQARLVTVEGRVAVALQVGSLSVGKAAPRVHAPGHTIVRSPTGDWVLLTTEAQLTKAEGIAFTVTYDGQVHEYALFLPALARLGQPESAQATRSYDGELGRVLHNIARRSGLVVLAEGKMERRVHAEVTDGAPRKGLEQIARRIGCEVRAEGYVYTLEPREPR